MVGALLTDFNKRVESLPLKCLSTRLLWPPVLGKLGLCRRSPQPSWRSSFVNPEIWHNSDTLNSKGVPRDFVECVVTNDDIRTQLLCLDKGSVILKAAVWKRKTKPRLEGGGAATVVGAAAGCEAHIDVKQAARLSLPNGASNYDFHPTGRMYQYAKKNSRKLLKFAEELGYEIGNEGLLVVTGVTKASAWSITQGLKSWTCDKR
ncbi:hypothetical protein B0H16DRAFT_1713781 [Mycena metata]|uniref:Uncharacterized protein n=1 Tax=Mycena metata TaxID=1033252 RepID=A0AAD7JXG3_9AGAR|nr:hypothetical protein B0H16DRAFT_1713781 [Mycena metata]